MTVARNLAYTAVSAVGGVVSCTRGAMRPAVRMYRHARLMLQLRDVVDALDATGRLYMVGGGLSYDGHRGRLTRRHEDLDLCVFDHDLAVIRGTLEGLGFEYLDTNQDAIKFARPGFRLDVFVWHRVGTGTDAYVEHAFQGRTLRIPEAVLRPVSVDVAGVRFPIQPIWVLRLMPTVRLHPADRAYVETIPFPEGLSPVECESLPEVPRPCITLAPSAR